MSGGGKGGGGKERYEWEEQGTISIRVVDGVGGRRDGRSYGKGR